MGLLDDDDDDCNTIQFALLRIYFFLFDIKINVADHLLDEMEKILVAAQLTERVASSSGRVVDDGICLIHWINFDDTSAAASAYIIESVPFENC